MAGPTKRPKRPVNHEAGAESSAEESDSGTYHGQQIESDMESYVKYRLVGGRIKLKKGVVPHKFECQKSINVKPERSAVHKRNKIKFFEELLHEGNPSTSVIPEEVFVAGFQKDDVKENPLDVYYDQSIKKSMNHKAVQVKLKNKVSHKSTVIEEKYFKKKKNNEVKRSTMQYKHLMDTVSISTSTDFSSVTSTEIIADFEGRNPEAHDFHGIQQLLQQLFLKAHVDLSQMTDMIIAQHGMGCVLKQESNDSDDEDEDADMNEENIVFGIATVINLNSHRETPCIQQFNSLLEELSNKHADPPSQAKIKEVLNKNIAFLINERYVNLPALVSLSMLNSLSSDIEKMKKKDPSYDFAYYIMISKTYKPKDNNEEEIFSNDEEEYFCKEAIVNFEFCVEDESDTGLGGKWLSEDKQVIPYRRVIIFEANKLTSILEKVSAVVQPQ